MKSVILPKNPDDTVQLRPGVQFVRRQLERGYFLTKAQWFSICSQHYYFNSACSLCTTGPWINVHRHRLMSWLHKRHYWLWHRIANRYV